MAAALIPLVSQASRQEAGRGLISIKQVVLCSMPSAGDWPSGNRVGWIRDATLLLPVDGRRRARVDPVGLERSVRFANRTFAHVRIRFEFDAARQLREVRSTS